MATKNLARTIIEGGRSHYNKWERSHSHRQERARTRAYVVRAQRREDGFDATTQRERPHVYKEFSDKLGAPRRWLRSQVGRPWDKVRSEIFSRFDPRTLAGQHIIFDHLLAEVRVHRADQRRSWRMDLYVDRRGILRTEQSHRRWAGAHLVHVPASVREWTAGRRVAGTEPALFWLERCRECTGCANANRRPCCCPSVERVARHGPHFHYRQARRFTDAELKLWRSLDARVRSQLRGGHEREA